MMTCHDLFNKYVRPLETIPTGMSPSGAPSNPVKAILSDIYGTLLISAPREKIALEDLPPLDDIRKTISGLASKTGLTQSAQKLFDSYLKAISEEHHRLRDNNIEWPEVRIDRIWQQVLGLDNLEDSRRFALAFELIINPIYPMPHLDDLLQRVSVSNLKTGIISNAQFYTPLTFEYFFGNPPERLCFLPDLIFYSYRFNRAKPSKQLFEAAADKLSKYGIRPANVLFLGNDMLKDIFPAHEQGFQTALFAGDMRSLKLREDDPRCRDLKPDIIITDLSQLSEMAGF